MNQTLLLHQENLQQRKNWMMISFILALIIVVETISLSFLSFQLSKKKEVVRYVEFSERGNFGFKVLPESNIDLSQRKLLIEKSLQDYVINRVSNVTTRRAKDNEIDASKVEFISALSSKKINGEYEHEVFRIYEDAAFIKRDVHILSFSEVENRKYRFDFNTIDTFENNVTKEQRWVVYLKYDLLNPNDLKVNEHKEINPLGIKITYYRGDIDKTRKIDIQNVNK